MFTYTIWLSVSLLKLYVLHVGKVTFLSSTEEIDWISIKRYDLSNMYSGVRKDICYIVIIFLSEKDTNIQNISSDF